MARLVAGVQVPDWYKGPDEDGTESRSGTSPEQVQAWIQANSPARAAPAGAPPAVYPQPQSTLNATQPMAMSPFQALSNDAQPAAFTFDFGGSPSHFGPSAVTGDTSGVINNASAVPTGSNSMWATIPGFGGYLGNPNTAAYQNTGGYNSTLAGAPGQPPIGAGFPSTTPPPTTAAPDSTGGPGMAPPDASFWSQLGLGDLATVPGVNLGQMPMMSAGFDPNFAGQYYNGINQQASQLGSYWDGAHLPTMQASTIGQTPMAQSASYQAPTMQAAQNGTAPQAAAQTPQSFEALQFLLSGQGFDPATLSRMRAQATDQISNQGAAEMSAGRLAAQRAGLGGSGLGIGLQEQAARDQAANQSSAMNNISIQDALQGMQNRQAGAGLENTRQMDASQQANLVALQNMQATLAAMQQNTQNVQQSGLANQAQQGQAGQSNAAMAQQAAMQNASQMMQALSQNSTQAQQANAANYGGQQQFAQDKAQAQTSQAQQGYGAYNTAALNQAVGSNQQNAANQFNWNIAQGNLNNNTNQFNANVANNANQGAMGNLVSLINGTAPANYTGQGNVPATSQTPYSALANLTAAYAGGQGSAPANQKQVGA